MGATVWRLTYVFLNYVFVRLTILINTLLVHILIHCGVPQLTNEAVLSVSLRRSSPNMIKFT